MTDRRSRMLEDKYLRDSARALVEADVEHLRSDIARKGFAERIIDRVREGATDLYDEAIDVADENKGTIAALVAAIVVWISRNPLLEMLCLEPDYKEDDGDQGPER